MGYETLYPTLLSVEYPTTFRARIRMHTLHYCMHSMLCMYVCPCACVCHVSVVGLYFKTIM